MAEELEASGRMSSVFDILSQELRLYKVFEGENPTPGDITAFETSIGYSLPADYRGFLKIHGFSASKGGMMCPIPGRALDDGPGIGVFFGLLDKHAYDLYVNRSLYLERPATRRLPEDKLAIATSPDAAICISLKGTEQGSIYCWGEYAETDDFMDNTCFLAPNFTAFVNSIRLMRK